MFALPVARAQDQDSWLSDGVTVSPRACAPPPGPPRTPRANRSGPPTPLPANASLFFSLFLPFPHLGVVRDADRHGVALQLGPLVGGGVLDVVGDWSGEGKERRGAHRRERTSERQARWWSCSRRRDERVGKKKTRRPGRAPLPPRRHDPVRRRTTARELGQAPHQAPVWVAGPMRPGRPATTARSLLSPSPLRPHKIGAPFFFFFPCSPKTHKSTSTGSARPGTRPPRRCRSAPPAWTGPSGRRGRRRRGGGPLLRGVREERREEGARGGSKTGKRKWLESVASPPPPPSTCPSFSRATPHHHHHHPPTHPVPICLRVHSFICNSLTPSSSLK